MININMISIINIINMNNIISNIRHHQTDQQDNLLLSKVSSSLTAPVFSSAYTAKTPVS